MKFFLTHLLIAWVLTGCGDKQNESSGMDTNKLPTTGKEKAETDSGTVMDLSKMKTEDSGNSTDGDQVPDENSEELEDISKVSHIQAILMKANPDYRGQGNIHEEGGTIVAAEFPSCGLRDLSPLRGLKLQALDLSGNPVREIRHLRGMPLTRLFLEYTLVESLEELREAKLVELRLNGSPVRSLAGLEGQPLENLYAVGTQINNISALASSNLRQLWLTESPVSDLSPLEGLPLVSLTAHRTLVEDLSFVRKLPLLQRLHIGETLIKDLSALGGLNLSRLVFTPGRIERGLKVVQGLSNLSEIGTKFDDQGRDLMPPDAFWAQFKP